jgi:hypothetical protein
MFPAEMALLLFVMFCPTYDGDLLFWALVVSLTHQLVQNLFCSLDEPFLFGYQISLCGPAANERKPNFHIGNLVYSLADAAKPID